MDRRLLVRRLLKDLAAYWIDLIRTTLRAWNTFFFTPADPTPLGVIRVGVGLLALWNLIVYGMDLSAFLGPEGWGEPNAVAQALAERSPMAWSFWLWLPAGLLRPVWAACLVVVALFTVGLFSRVTAVLTWLIVVATARRAIMANFGFDQMLSCLTFYLMVTGASGQAVALDRFLDRWRHARSELRRRRRDGKPIVPPGAPAPSVTANLGLRLIQLHFCLIYGMAGLSKLQGRAWWAGDAAWLVAATGEFRRFDLTWLALYPDLLNLATHLTILVEVGFPVLVWVRVVRPLLLVAITAMHFVIDLMLGLTEFGLAMITGLIAFASGPWLRSLVAGRGGPAGTVYYDGACSRCRASVALVAAADPDRIIEPIDLTAVEPGALPAGLSREGCLRALHLVRADGRIVSGYDAMITLMRWLPLFWPLGVLGALPGVTWIGRRVYNQLAVTRPRDPDAATCPLPTAPRPRDAGFTAEPTRH
ncbi:MAG: DUF393 domain-containing protein [Isosphaeraceae bacterium]|nr:DUF393 domain-containing protein [Isosphaeraceae bacterium]